MKKSPLTEGNIAIRNCGGMPRAMPRRGRAGRRRLAVEGHRGDHRRAGAAAATSLGPRPFGPPFSVVLAIAPFSARRGFRAGRPPRRRRPGNNSRQRSPHSSNIAFVSHPAPLPSFR